MTEHAEPAGAPGITCGPGGRVQKNLTVDGYRPVINAQLLLAFGTMALGDTDD